MARTTRKSAIQWQGWATIAVENEQELAKPLQVDFIALA